MRTTAGIPVASRVRGFVYAIRNIVNEARKVEAAGRKVRYLNIGDPITFGFKTPPHLVEAVERAMRDGHNGYAPSVGILPAREAVAGELSRRGMPMSPDRVVITSGTSEGIELTLTALAEAGDEVLVPSPTYPLYTAVLAGFAHRSDGPAAAIRVLRGLLLGLFAFVTFFFTLTVLLTRTSIVVAFAVALTCALAIHGASLWPLYRGARAR